MVIVDIVMPDLTGPDTLMELTREFLNIKAIAISGVFRDKYPMKTARLLGVRQTLRKPFQLEDMLKAVRYDKPH
jgi:DNA-binding NarL/FixJ family response regulator